MDGELTQLEKDILELRVKKGYTENEFGKSFKYLCDFLNLKGDFKKIEKPKIIFYKSIDRGDGIKADALPGSVYWTSQKGASKAMEQKQIDDIKAQKADFIITEEIDSISLNKRISALESYGYKVAYRFTAKDKWYLVRVLLTNHSELCTHNY